MGEREVILDLIRADDASDAHAFRWTTQTYIRRIVGGLPREAELRWKGDVREDLIALAALHPDPAAGERIGLALADFLRELGWDHDARVLESSTSDEPVFLTLRFAAAELYALPWGRVPVGSTSLSAVPHVHLRFELPGVSTAAPQPDPPLEGGRLLLVWAGAVPVGEHSKAIAAALAAAHLDFDRETDVLGHATARALAQRLSAARDQGRPYSALHVLVHGASVPSREEAFGLALDDGVLDPAAFQELLHRHASALRLVVLCVCKGGDGGAPGGHLGGLAQRAHGAGVASVVAARSALHVDASVVWSKVLYGGLLGELKSLEAAVADVREALRDRGESEEAANLQLWAHAGDGSDTRPFVFAPYRGLRAFDPQHAQIFFGRESEIEELIDELGELTEMGPRFHVVEGASGSGKSSMVLGGVVPRLLVGGWRYRRMVPSGDPIGALATAKDQLLDADAQGYLLVVDQFEELFTLVDRPEVRAEFVDVLWRLSQQETPRVHIISTLRSDFRGRCGEVLLAAGLPMDQLFRPERSVHHVFVAALQYDTRRLREIITSPAARLGLFLEDGLEARIMSDIEGEPGALPLLEFALRQLWLRRRGRLLTHAAYEALGAEGSGGVVGALREYAEAALADLNKLDRQLARRLLVRLVSVGTAQVRDTRRRVPLSEVPVPSGDREALAAVVDRLVEARLVVRDDSNGDTTVEVAHEALIRSWPRLQGWVEEDRQKLTELAVVEGWVEQRAEFGALLTGDQLGYARQVEARYHDEFSVEARVLVEESGAAEAQRKQADADRLRRRARRSQLVALVGLIVVVIFGVLWNKAKDAAALAGDRALLAAAGGSAADPMIVAALLREVRRQGETPGWMSLAASLGQRRASLMMFEGHEGGVWSAAFSPDGEWVITASYDGTARVWSADGTGVPITLDVGAAVFSASFSPDGERVVTASRDGIARVWPAWGEGEVVELVGHTAPVVGASFSASGARIVTASSDGTARVWSVDGTGESIEFDEHNGPVLVASFSPDGERVVTASSDGTARVWSVDGGGTSIVLGEYGRSVVAASFSPDGEQVVTASDDGTAHIWFADGIGAPVVLGDHEGSVNSASFSPDGERVVTASEDGTARVWFADGLGKPVVLNGHSGAIGSASFSSDGRRVVTASDDGTARVWSVDGTAVPFELDGHTAAVGSATFSPDGRWIVTNSDDGTARVWSGEQLDAVVALEGYTGAFSAASVSLDGAWVVTGLEDGSVGVWPASGGVPEALDAHESAVTAASFSPDAARVVIGSYDGVVGVQSVDGGASRVLQRSGAVITSASFSPSGDRIVVASDDPVVRVWPADGSGDADELEGHTDRVWSASFSADGARVVTASADETVRLWDAGEGGGWTSVVLGEHTAPVYYAALSPNGEQVVTASDDNIVRVWPVDGKDAPVVLDGHEDVVRSALFSADGERVVTASHDGTARVWSTSGSGAPAVLGGHDQWVLSAAFFSDGMRVVTVSRDKTVRDWLVDPDALKERLWRVSAHCIPARKRIELLGESVDDATAGFDECRKMVTEKAAEGAYR